MTFPLVFLAFILPLSFSLPITNLQDIPQQSLRTLTSVSTFFYFLSFAIILIDYNIDIVDSSNTLAFCSFYLHSDILHLYSKPLRLAIFWTLSSLRANHFKDVHFFLFSTPFSLKIMKLVVLVLLKKILPVS